MSAVTWFTSGRNIDVAATVQELSANLFQFQQSGYLCDTVIIADDGQLTAHSVVLAAASPVFRRALKSTDKPIQHVILLPDMQIVVISIIIQFVYTGRIDACDKLVNIMAAINELEIKLHVNRYLCKYRNHLLVTLFGRPTYMSADLCFTTDSSFFLSATLRIR